MNYEIIESVERCQEVVAELMTHHVISADAEGINLGRDGPLTLLQIGTRDGHVYLFDVQNDKKMFKDGGLKKLLESNTVLKVFHSCNRDSEALWYQFNVKLHNVFDVQVGQMVIREKEGLSVERSPKLPELCEIYTDIKMEEKGDIQRKWNKSVIDYWEQRPFTKEMIEYSCADVRVLLPDMYENMNRKLKEIDAMQLFQERVEEKMNYLMNDDLKTKRRNRMVNAAKAVLVEMGKTGVTSITTEDQKEALSRNWTPEEISLYMRSNVQELVYTKVMEGLRDIEKEMDKDKADFDPEVIHLYTIRSAKNYPRREVADLANNLYLRFKRIVYDDMQRKYKMSTPMYYLREQEKMLLKDIRINNKSDESKYPPLLVAFLYKLSTEDFNDLRQRLLKDPSQVTISKGFYSFLGYQSKKTYIPSSLRAAASQLIEVINQVGKRPLR